MNFFVFFLPMALADRAFKDYGSIEDLLAIDLPPGQDAMVLKWSPQVLDLGIFRTMTADGPTTQMQSSSSFLSQLRQLAERAGILKPIGVHAFRREVLLKVDGDSPPLRFCLAGSGLMGGL
jgi:hypothetical protein